MKKLFFCFGISALLFASCTKEYNVKLNNNMNVTIDGYVYDYATNLPMKDVKVTCAFKTQKTDTLGHYSISGLGAGGYRLTFRADSFGVMTDTVNASPKDFNFNNFTAELSTKMYKMNQTLNTQLLVDMGGKYSPAANAKYTINLGSKFSPNKIIGVADANGIINVSKLPDTEVTLVAIAQINNKEYRAMNGSDYFIISDPKSFKKTALMEMYSSNEAFYIAETNLIDNNGNSVSNFDAAGNMTVTFSLAVDTTNRNNSVTLYRGSSGSRLPAAISWSSDAKTLTINPAYKLLNGSSYYVQLNLRTGGGSSLYKSLGFYTSGDVSSDFSLYNTNLFDDYGNQQINFVKTNNIVITFSSAADTSNSNNRYSIYKSNNSYIACYVKWSADAKTLTLDPIGDYLETGANYNAQINIYPKNTNLSYFNYSFSFKVAGGAQSVSLDKVSGITKTFPTTISNTTNMVQITVNNVSGADFYAVYAKYNNGEYIRLTTFYYSSGATSSAYLYLTNLPNIVVPAAGLFSNNAEYDLVIRAETNSGAVGAFSNPMVLKTGIK